VKGEKTMRKYKRNRFTSLVACAVLILILVFGETAVTGELPKVDGAENRETLTDNEKAKVRMAVDLLKLTGDEGTLPDKVKDDPTIDGPETGISKGDLSNGGVAYGQYDGGY